MKAPTTEDLVLRRLEYWRSGSQPRTVAQLAAELHYSVSSIRNILHGLHESGLVCNQGTLRKPQWYRA